MTRRLVIDDGPGGTVSLVPRMRQPRHSGGPRTTDHGSSGHVVADVRRGGLDERRLVWFNGRHAGPGRGTGLSPLYVPARLEVIDGTGARVAAIASGGRLSDALLKAHAEAIDAAMESPVSRFLDHRRTLLVEEGNPDR